MAQIEQSDGGKKKKGAQKKMSIHVDFTPMVDMNMLLITFFMLCTTMIKSQTLNISLPSNEKIESEERACPVYSNRKDFEKISFIMRYPRLSFLMLLGIIVLIGGLFSSSILGALKFFFGV